MRTERLLLVSLLCTVGLFASAQTTESDYRPFAEEGKTWEIRVGPIKENIYGHSIDGDTLINGEIWKKVYNYIGFPNFQRTYYAALRDIGKKVYIIAAGSTKPRLLYNFDLKEGDILRCGVEGNTFACLLEADEMPDTLLGFPFVSYLKVERIENISFDGVPYRRYKLSFLDSYQELLRNEDGDESENVVWVEGIGSGAGPFSPWLLLPPKFRFIQYCTLFNDIIFSETAFYEDYESSVVATTRSITINSSNIHDLQGRRLTGEPAKGVYIQNGRKKVAK